MDLLIYIFSLGHSRHIENKPIVKSTKNKGKPHIILFTKHLTLYNN